MTHTASINELGQNNIRKLLWQYALPAIIGMVVMSLYNIIDGIFVGHWIGDDALAGLGIVMPIMNLTAAVGMLVGAGAATRVSIALGEGNWDEAEKIAATSLLMTLVLSGSTLFAIYLFLKPILIFSGADATTLPYAQDFLLVFLPGNLFLSLCFNFNAVMRSSGYPIKAMVTMFITVIVNTALAPLFIRTLDWGIKGAAAATVVAMLVGFVFVMQHFVARKSTIRLRKVHLFAKPHWESIRSIISIGMAPFCIQVAASAVVFLIIAQIKAYAGSESTASIGAFTIANRLMMLVLMIIIGLTQGMQPLVGYNYGAKMYHRVKEALNYTIRVATAVMVVSFALCQLMPEVLVGIFNPNSQQLADESVAALRYFTAMFPIVGFPIVVSSYFQSIGMAGQAIFLSLTRQVILLIPLLIVLPLGWGLHGVWLSVPVADFFATLIGTALYVWQIRKLNAEIHKQDSPTI